MGKRILLVDDELDFLEIMGMRIEHWGYRPITASNGKEAMKALADEKPDAIILDCLMPDINGVDLLKKIRAIDKVIPVVMFTAKPEVKAMDDSKRLGISAFVPKLSPFVDTQASLKNALDMALRRKGD